MAGHRRSNAGYVLSRRPDVIFVGGAAIPAHAELLAHPDFERLYCRDERVKAHVLRTRRTPTGQAVASECANDGA